MPLRVTRDIVKIVSESVSIRLTFRGDVPLPRFERTRLGPADKPSLYARTPTRTRDKNKLTFPFRTSVGGGPPVPSLICKGRGSSHREISKGKRETRIPLFRAPGKTKCGNGGNFLNQKVFPRVIPPACRREFGGGQYVKDVTGQGEKVTQV